MSNTLGKNLRLSIFGESHSEFIGATLDGMAPGIRIDYNFIDKCLSKRRPDGFAETQRVEKDDYKTFIYLGKYKLNKDKSTKEKRVFSPIKDVL